MNLCSGCPKVVNCKEVIGENVNRWQECPDGDCDKNSPENIARFRKEYAEMMENKNQLWESVRELKRKAEEAERSYHDQCNEIVGYLKEMNQEKVDVAAVIAEYASEL